MVGSLSTSDTGQCQFLSPFFFFFLARKGSVYTHGLPIRTACIRLAAAGLCYSRIIKKKIVHDPRYLNNALLRGSTPSQSLQRQFVFTNNYTTVSRIKEK